MLVTINFSGQLPADISSQIPPGKVKDGKGSISHKTNDVMTAVFHGYLHGVNEPLRWKLASIGSVFFATPQKMFQ